MSRRFNRYFTPGNAPSPPASNPSVASLNKIFDLYRGTSYLARPPVAWPLLTPSPLNVEQTDPPNTITVNGAMKYLQDIDIGLEEPTILVIAELLQAPTMGEFAREGFVDGWKVSGY